MREAIKLNKMTINKKVIILKLLNNFDKFEQWYCTGLCAYIEILRCKRKLTEEESVIASELVHKYIKENTFFNRIFFDTRRVKTLKKHVYYFTEGESQPRLEYLQYIYERLCKKG